MTFLAASRRAAAIRSCFESASGFATATAGSRDAARGFTATSGFATSTCRVVGAATPSGSFAAASRLARNVTTGVAAAAVSATAFMAEHPIQKVKPEALAAK